MEQLAARRAHNPKVGGSNPPPATMEVQMQLHLDFFLSKRSKTKNIIKALYSH